MILNHHLYTSPVRSSEAVPTQHRIEQERRDRLVRLVGSPPVRRIVIPPKAKTTFEVVMENATLRPLILNICADFKVSPRDVIDAKRGRFNRARDELLAQVHEDTGWSLAEVSRVFHANRRSVTEAVHRARPASPSIWTQAKVKELTRLHGMGVTYSVIAAVLGTSRNAVIGKVSRLGLNQSVKFSTEFPPLSTLTTGGA